MKKNGFIILKGVESGNELYSYKLDFIFPKTINVKVNYTSGGKNVETNISCNQVSVDMDWSLAKKGSSKTPMIVKYNYDFNSIPNDANIKSITFNGNYTNSTLKGGYSKKGIINLIVDSDGNYTGELDKENIIVLGYNFIYNLMVENRMFTDHDIKYDKPAFCTTSTRGFCAPIPFWKDYVCVPSDAYNLSTTLSTIAHELGHHLDGEVLGTESAIFSGVLIDPNYSGSHPNYDKLSDNKKEAVITLETVSSITSIVITDYLNRTFNTKISASTYKDSAFSKFDNIFDTAKTKLAGKSLKDCGEFLKKLSSKASYKERKELIESL